MTKCLYNFTQFTWDLTHDPLTIRQFFRPSSSTSLTLPTPSRPSSRPSRPGPKHSLSLVKENFEQRRIQKFESHSRVKIG